MCSKAFVHRSSSTTASLSDQVTALAFLPEYLPSYFASCPKQKWPWWPHLAFHLSMWQNKYIVTLC